MYHISILSLSGGRANHTYGAKVIYGNQKSVSTRFLKYNPQSQLVVFNEAHHLEVTLRKIKFVIFEDSQDLPPLSTASLNVRQHVTEKPKNVEFVLAFPFRDEAKLRLRIRRLSPDETEEALTKNISPAKMSPRRFKLDSPRSRSSSRTSSPISQRTRGLNYSKQRDGKHPKALYGAPKPNEYLNRSIQYEDRRTNQSKDFDELEPPQDEFTLNYKDISPKKKVGGTEKEVDIIQQLVKEKENLSYLLAQSREDLKLAESRASSLEENMTKSVTAERTANRKLKDLQNEQASLLHDFEQLKLEKETLSTQHERLIVKNDELLNTLKDENEANMVLSLRVSKMKDELSKYRQEDANASQKSDGSSRTSEKFEQLSSSLESMQYKMDHHKLSSPKSPFSDISRLSNDIDMEVSSDLFKKLRFRYNQLYKKHVKLQQKTQDIFKLLRQEMEDSDIQQLSAFLVELESSYQEYINESIDEPSSPQKVKMIELTRYEELKKEFQRATEKIHSYDHVLNGLYDRFTVSSIHGLSTEISSVVNENQELLEENNRLNTMINMIDSRKQDNKSPDKQTAQLRRQIRDLRNDSNTMAEQLEAITSKSKTLATELQYALDTNEKLSNENKKLKHNVDISPTKSDISSVSSTKKKHIASSLSKLKKSLARSHDELHATTEQLKFAQSRLETYENRVHLLVDRNKKLTIQNVNMRAFLKKHALDEYRLEDFHQENQRLNHNLGVKDGELEQLSHTVTNLRETVSELDSVLMDRNQQITTLAKQVVQLELGTPPSKLDNIKQSPPKQLKRHSSSATSTPNKSPLTKNEIRSLEQYASMPPPILEEELPKDPLSSSRSSLRQDDDTQEQLNHHYTAEMEKQERHHRHQIASILQCLQETQSDLEVARSLARRTQLKLDAARIELSQSEHLATDEDILALNSHIERLQSAYDEDIENFGVHISKLSDSLEKAASETSAIIEERNAIQHQLQDEIRRRERELSNCKDTIEELKLSHDKEKADWTLSLKEHEEVKQLLTNKCELLNNSIEDIKQEYEEKKQNVDAQLEENTHYYKEKLQHAEEQCSNASKAFDTLKSQLELKHAEELKRMEEQYQQNIDDIKDNYSSELESLRANYTGEKKALNDMIDSSMESNDKKNDQMIASLNQSHQDALTLKDEKHALDVQKMKRAHKKELDNVRLEYEDQLNELVASQKQEIQKLEHAQQAEITQLNEENDQLNEEYEQTIDSFKNTIDTLKQENKRVYTELVQVEDTSRVENYQSRIQELEEECIVLKGNITNSQQERGKLLQEMKSTSDALTQSQNKLSKLLITEGEFQSLKVRHEGLRAAHEEQVQLFADKKNELEAKLTMLKKDYESLCQAQVEREKLKAEIMSNTAPISEKAKKRQELLEKNMAFDDVSTYKNRVEYLEGQVAHFEDEKQRYEATISQLNANHESQIEGLSQQIAHARREMESKTMDYENANQQLKDIMKGYQEEIKQKEESLSLLRDNVSKKDAQLNNISKALDQREEDLASLQASLEGNLNEQKNLESLQLTIDQQVKELTTLRAAHSRLSSTLEKQSLLLETKTQENASLMKELEMVTIRYKKGSIKQSLFKKLSRPATLYYQMEPKEWPSIAIPQVPRVDDAGLEKCPQKVSYILHEFIESEQKYVNYLKIFQDFFMEPLNPESFMARSSLQDIPNGESLDMDQVVIPNQLLSFSLFKEFFDNVVQVYTINTLFLSSIEKLLVDEREEDDHPPCISVSNYEAFIDTFLSICQSFKLYITYIIAYNTTIKKIKAQLAQPGLQAFADSRSQYLRSQKLRIINFSGFFILPVQRIPRYRLFLSDLLKQFDKHPLHDALREKLQKAVDLICDIADFCNEKTKHSHRVKRLMELSDLYSIGNHLQPHHKIVFEVEMASRVTVDGLKPCHFVLLSDAMLILFPRSKSFVFYTLSSIASIQVDGTKNILFHTMSDDDDPVKTIHDETIQFDAEKRDALYQSLLSWLAGAPIES